MGKITPILKWAGGKRQLLAQLIPLIPSDYSRYYEPFLGAGAMLFELMPKRAVVNDTNTELINVYSVIKEKPEELIETLKTLEKGHSKEQYYKIRDIDRDYERFSGLSDIQKAARTIYLNRTCYNGLYRVNKAGCFNTPMGYNSTIRIVNEKGISSIHDYLTQNDIKILNTDYSKALKWLRKSDFVFLDPPYYPMSDDFFIRYDSVLFGANEQKRLKEQCDALTDKGIRFIETNSNCQEIKDLYHDYRLIEVDVRRNINAIATGRRSKELIILNY